MKKLLLILNLLLLSIGYGQETTIKELRIEGLKKTKESFIRRLVKTKEDKALDSVKIITDIERLKRLPGIANAEYSIKTNPEGQSVLTYKIEENFTIIPGLRISTANNGEFAFRVSAFEFNLLGRNQLVGAFYQRDVFDSYGAFWEAPYLFTNKLGIGLNYQDLSSLEPVFFDQGTIKYRFRSQAGEVKFLYEYDFKNKIALGARLSKEEYELDETDVILNTTEEVPDFLSTDRFTYFGEYEHVDLNIEYQYVSGFRSLLNVQFVTGNDKEEFLNDFFIARNDFEYFKRVGQKGNWANRLRLAYASNNDSSPFAPFAVDNELNIRGAGNTIDRGTAAIVINTEYRHTFYEKGWFVLQGNAFIDAGSWRNPGGDLGELFDGSTIRVNPGVGLRFIHKRIFNAVFRIDYGYGLNENGTNGIVFGIGQYF